MAVPKQKQTVKPKSRPRSTKKRRSAVAKKHLGFLFAKQLLAKRTFWFFVGVAAFAFLWAAVVGHVEPKPTALGAPNPAPVVSNDYKSLDLNLAKQASYNNSALNVVKDLGPTNGVKRSVVTFGVPKDNLFEYAFMTMPAAAAPSGKYPVIILCHGYADPSTYSTPGMYLEDMNFYSQHGFAVIKPDLRGQGLSLAKGSPDGAYFSMGYNTDVLSLIAAIKQTSYLNSKAINLWGHSMGAYVALRASVLSPDVKSIILLSLPGDPVEQAEQSYITLSDRENPDAMAVRSQQITEHGVPLQNRGFWDNTEPNNFLQNTQAKVQIHVGAADDITIPLFAADLDKKLTGLSRPHGYYIYSGAGHSLQAQRPLIWQRSLQLLNQ